MNSITIETFTMTMGLGPYYLAEVYAISGQRGEFFSIVGKNPLWCIRELEAIISLKFDTIFTFEEPTILFSEN